jgi:hypothetical protein
MLKLLPKLLSAASITWLAPVALLLLILARIVVRVLFLSPRDVPGPFLARFSRLWYLRQVLKGNFEKTNIELHRRYGKPCCNALQSPAK